ncbi:MAG: NAD(P)/FAD-dependent oxidoreductase [Candidatus Azobacteroides sp.]|nr:NAD(P)/FAD-dependent oxidoreductase [Candidatus Azobacteroides sp.]
MTNNIPSESGKKRVVIVGGGFGGLKLAGKLDPKYFQVVLLDKNNYHQFQPLLYQVAITGLEESSIAYPFRKNFQKKQVHFRMGELLRLVPEENKIETSIGDITYDYLVLACGCDTNFFGNDKLRDTTLTLKSVSDAIFLRNHILQSFEDATITNDPGKLEKLLTFVIVGGGATGVELAGALADMKNNALPKDYPELDFSNMQIHLIDASPRLLAAMSEDASSYVAETLKKRGIIIHQDVSVSSYEDDIITVNNGTVLHSKNVLWVAGIKGNTLNGLKPENYGRGNRIIVDEYCRLNGYENIFAIGDNAIMSTPDYPNGHPQMAQGAIQMADLVRKNLEKIITGQQPDRFRYKDKGSLATIGRNAAVADLGKFEFCGRFAWWLWLWVHIFTILGVKNKILVMIDWAWNYVTYDISLRILIRPKKQ